MAVRLVQLEMRRTLSDSGKVVLAVGAHTDDVEIGCGATLHRLVESGWKAVVFAASRAEDSLPVGAPVDQLEVESRRALERIGISDLRVPGYKVRELQKSRQRILDDLISIRSELRPNLVLTHCSTDSHQDHEVIHRESVRAFRHQKLWGYHLPWNERSSNSQGFVEVGEKNLEAKLSMLREYESQMKLGRPYVSQKYVYAAAGHAGLACQAEYAESFEIISMKWGLDDDIA